MDSDTNIRQTFTARYKKSFKANGKTDVNLDPLLEWNLTSAYGCYSGAEGTDPD